MKTLADGNSQMTSLTELSPIGATGYSLIATTEAQATPASIVMPENSFNWWLLAVILFAGLFIIWLMHKFIK